jgi:hypothetical protein
MDGSKTNESTGAGTYCHGMRQRFSFSLGQYAIIFQAKVYAIKACTDDNIKRGYHNGNIYILSDSQAAIKAPDICKIYSKLVWDCDQFLMTVAKCNKVHLMWMQGHMGTEDNETGNKLTRMCSLYPLTGPELT